MSNVADEAFGNIRTVKAFSNEVEETNKFTVHNNQVYATAKIFAIWYGGFSCFTIVFLYGAMTAIIFLASKLY